MATASDRDIPETAYALGELRHDFRVSRGALVMHVVAVVLCVALLGAAVYKNLPVLAGAKDASVLVLVVVFVAGLAGTIYGAMSVARYLRRRNLRVLAFAEGFVCFREGQSSVCRWDELDTVHEHITAFGHGHFRRLTIRNRQRHEWVFDMRSDLLEDFPRLTQIVHEEEARYHVPLALADLHAGRTVDCAAIQLTPDGLACAGDLLPWHLLQQVTSEDWTLRIYARGSHSPWQTVSANEVVNLCMLLAVAKEKAAESELPSN